MRARLRPLSAPHRPFAGHPPSAVPTAGGPITARIELKDEPIHPVAGWLPVRTPGARASRQAAGARSPGRHCLKLSRVLIRCHIPVGDLRVQERGEAGSVKGESQ